jgi:hypothetical protein
MQPFVAAGRARLVQGDALNKEDVRRGWERAAEPANSDLDSDAAARVDVLLFTVGARLSSLRTKIIIKGRNAGGKPSFHLTRGIVISPPDLVTRALLNALATLPARTPPRIVVLTGAGISRAGHAALPAPVRALYAYLLRVPHRDKEGAEALLARAMGAEGEKGAPEVLPAGWETELGLAPGALRESVVVVRPALLTQGACVADTKGSAAAYRVRAEGDLPVAGGYTISRRDTAHFVVERLLGDEWEAWKGRGVSLAY